MNRDPRGPSGDFDPDGWDRMARGQAGGAAWIFERAIERVAELAGSPSPGGSRRLLDVGCGTGRLATKLVRAGWEVTALDRDSLMVRRACAWDASSVDVGFRSVVTADATALPFRNATFARITASSLLGCLDDADTFLAEAYRCLEPDGALILTATNRDSWLLKLNHALPRAWVVPKSAGPRQKFTTYSFGELRGRLHGAGFRVDPCHAFNFVVHAGPILFPPRSVARGLDSFGVNGALRRRARNLVAVAWKPA
ncbi:MAG TPA: class I SAM-dependent methyltransferase [Candidatus Eisenbacteria bacterium]